MAFDIPKRVPALVRRAHKTRITKVLVPTQRCAGIEGLTFIKSSMHMSLPRVARGLKGVVTAFLPGWCVSPALRGDGK